MSIKVERTSLHCEASEYEFFKSISKGSGKDGLEVPFASAGDAFVVFACLGYHHGRYEPLKVREEVTLSVYLDQDLQLPILGALAFARLREEKPNAPLEELAENLLSIKTIIPLVEGWANGGLQVFKEATAIGYPHLTLALMDVVAAAHPELLNA